jgi:hypothetical protein
MSVVLKDGTVYLEGPCRVEDAEPLLTLLRSGDAGEVDIARAAHLHAAVIQILLVFRPRIARFPADGFLKTWIEPLLRQNPPD